MPESDVTPPLAPLGGAGQTPIAFVVAIVQAYAQRGLSPEAVLRLAQIRPENLENSSTRISARQMELISGAAMQELDDEGLGWFSRRLPWGSYGMLARASISAPTLGVALKRWCRHHGLITSDIALKLQVTGRSAVLSITEHRDLGTLREFCLVSVLRNVHGVACWLVDSRIGLQAARFPLAPPPHAPTYQVLFSGPTTFGAAHASIQFDARYLSLPLRRDEAALRQMLQHALPLTVLQYRRDRLLVQRVRQTLRSQPQSIHNAQDLAELLHVSVRTLHRQLKDEGASLQALKDEVRRLLAQDLLLRTQHPIKQVAQASGFLNEKSFMRAFRGWTGTTPGAFRQNGQAITSHGD